jgi:hypothetical protein
MKSLTKYFFAKPIANSCLSRWDLSEYAFFDKYENQAFWVFGQNFYKIMLGLLAYT